MDAGLSITDDQAVELAERFRLMGEASRLRIMLACLHAPTCVWDLAARTRLSQSVVSHVPPAVVETPG
jgi:ArsR family transcriptional regulator, lead/cadmium/zinc/bismuth-responsive transcriptional repressor